MILEGRTSSEKIHRLFSAEQCGKILAVFSSGIYLEVADQILMFHDAENGFLPFGIALENFKDRGRDFGLEPGMKIECSNNLLSCPAVDFFVNVYKAEKQEKFLVNNLLPAFAESAAFVSELESRSTLSVYASCKLDSLNKDDIEDIFARAAYGGLQMLVDAMNLCNAQLMNNAVNKLLGLGRGLTPSLDDFMCGMLFVMHYSERVWNYKQPYLPLLADILKREAPNRTNVYSSAYLMAAAEGDDFTLLRRCLEEAKSPDFHDCLQSLLAIGSSSGADMLSGMIFAANYILKQQCFTL